MGPLFAALAASVVVLSNPPPKAPTPPVHKQQAKTAKPDAQTRTDDRGTEKQPLFVKSIESEDAAQERARIRKETESKAANDADLVWWTFILAIATIVLSVFTFFIVAIAGGQLAMFRKQLGIMKDGAKDAETLARATAATAKAAEFQAAALVATQRAYVKASPVPPGIQQPPPSNGLEHLTCNFKVENYGQTPAQVTDMVTIFKLIEKSQTLPNVPDYETEEVAPFPGHFLGRNEVFFNGHGEATQVEAGIADAVRTGKVSLFAYGYIDYIDAFGQHHRCGFGREFHPGVDNRSLYDSDEKFSERCNLAFMRQPSYNYDRLRKKGEGNDWD